MTPDHICAAVVVYSCATWTVRYTTFALGYGTPTSIRQNQEKVVSRLLHESTELRFFSGNCSVDFFNVQPYGGPFVPLNLMHY